MKYFFVSDIHGNYDKLIKSLTDANFNSDTDTLVSVGDAFDRGSQNIEVLNYLMNLKNRILIWGNHDKRLCNLIYKTNNLQWFDISNGTILTISQFSGVAMENAGVGLDVLYTKGTEASRLLDKYFSECVNCVEFPTLIATHGWLPYTAYDYNRRWRTASQRMWDEAMWANTEDCLLFKMFPKKTLLVGHWHAWRLARKVGERKPNDEEKTIDCSTFFYEDKLIAIDGCSNAACGVVNTYVYETKGKPKFY